jgi:hypothetical protein
MSRTTNRSAIQIAVYHVLSWRCDLEVEIELLQSSYLLENLYMRSIWNLGDLHWCSVEVMYRAFQKTEKVEPYRVREAEGDMAELIGL